MAALQDCTKSIADLLACVKKGAVGEIMCDQALEQIKKMVSDIDSAVLFASAGQLESGGKASKSDYNESFAQLKAAADTLSKEFAQLPATAAGSDIQIGEATKVIASDIATLGQRCSACASQFRLEAHHK